MREAERERERVKERERASYTHYKRLRARQHQSSGKEETVCLEFMESRGGRMEIEGAMSLKHCM